MKNNYFIEPFDEFIRKKRIIECIKRLKKQRTRESFYYSEDDFEWLMEIKSDWLKKKDGRQYIKKDGSEGVFVPYKNIGARVATTVGGLVVGKLVRKGIEKVANQNKNHKATNDDVNVANRMSQRANRQWDKDNRKIQRDTRIKDAQKKTEQKETFETRKKNRDEHWENKIKNVDAKDKIRIKQNRDAINSIFSEINYEYNEKRLKKHGLTDEQIKKIEYGSFSHIHNKKSEKGIKYLHITSGGGIGGRSNLKITFNENGKITDIGDHDDDYKK